MTIDDTPSLIQPLPAVRHAIQKCPRLAVEKLHVRRQRQQQARGDEMCEFHVEVPPEMEGL